MRTLLLLLIINALIVCNAVTLYSQEKKVLMHYMLWYGDSLSAGDDSLRHWIYGHENTPIIGKYNSKSWPLLTYHVLLSHSCGIDGIVANVKDGYDKQSFKNLINVIRDIQKLDSTNFNYSFSISYDDQKYDIIDSLKKDMTYLKDSILPFYKNYLRVNDTAIVFVFNYENEYLSVQEYKSALEEIFPDTIPKLCWNESQDSVMGYVDVCYPRVQPYDQQWDTVNGKEWGKQYLEDFFWRINNIPQQYNSELMFACSGVWPGFNDTCNIEWGEGRWMDRQNGAVYDSTWLLTYNYNCSLPLKWVIIETFNDFNEGTEIEPSIEYGYQYLDSTIKRINLFKSSSVSLDDNRYTAAKQLYDAGYLIEHTYRDSINCYPIYKNAIINFIENKFLESMASTDSIINNLCTTSNIPDVYDISNSIEIYPNPTGKLISIKLNNNEIKGVFYSILLNTEGKEIRKIKLNKCTPTYEYDIDIKGLKAGVYYLIITDGKYKGQQKVIVI